MPFGWPSEFRNQDRDDPDLHGYLGRRLRHIAEQNHHTLERLESLMATAADLTTALAQCQADLAALVAAGVGGIPPAELDPVLQAVNDLDGAIKAAIPAPPA